MAYRAGTASGCWWKKPDHLLEESVRCGGAARERRRRPRWSNSTARSTSRPLSATTSRPQCSQRLQTCASGTDSLTATATVELSGTPPNPVLRLFAPARARRAAAAAPSSHHFQLLVVVVVVVDDDEDEVGMSLQLPLLLLLAVPG